MLYYEKSRWVVLGLCSSVEVGVMENMKVTDLLEQYEAQDGDQKADEKVYVAYKKIADESCCGALCKTCACFQCCG